MSEPDVPSWALLAAVTAPVALVVSSTVATLLPTSPYDPIGQTLSVLAALPGSAPVMTAGFVLTAVCQISTAAGLHALRPAPRILLAFAGVCGLGVAALPVSSRATRSPTCAPPGRGSSRCRCGR